MSELTKSLYYDTPIEEWKQILNDNMDYHYCNPMFNSDVFSNVKTVLDIGCGWGGLARELRNKFNLDVTTYSDGTPIPQVSSPTEWSNLTTGAWCYYNNDPANGVVYGKLYNWYAVAGIHDNDPTTPNKTLAPSGWRMPSNNDWTELTDFLGAREVAGSKMKATGTALWVAPNIATNESGFTGLPGGERVYDFEGIGRRSGWWSSNEISLDQARGRSIINYSPFSFIYNAYKNMGLSVRCVYGETYE